MIRLKDLASINISGNSATSTSLTSSAGSATQPIYFSNGKPVSCTYTLAKSVPSDAKFTDTNTTYSAGTGLSLSGTSFSVNYGTSAGTACQGNDSRLSNARPASDVYSWAKASSKPSYTYSEVGAAASSHSHTTLTGVYTSNGGSQPPSYVGANAVKCNMMNSFLGTGVSFSSYADVLMMNAYSWSDVPYATALAIQKTSGAPRAWIAAGGNTSSWAGATEIITAKNIGSQSVNYANSAGSVSWSNVSGKPSTFTPSSHSHSYIPTSGGAISGYITRNSGGSWISGRDNAVVKQLKSNNSGSSWNPVCSVKTQLGNWTFGSVGGETLMLSYDTDANYNKGSNTSAVIEFPVAGSIGTLALTSSTVAAAGYVTRDRGVNSVSTLTGLPVTKSTVIATLSSATSISLAAHMNIGESVTIFCNPTASFTQPIPTSGSFISMDGSSFSVTSGKRFEINIYCYNTNVYSISCKTAS